MRLINISSEKRDRINTILLCLIAATLPFFINIGNLAVILAISFNVIFFRKTSFEKMGSIEFWFPLVFFLITIVSGCFSKNSDHGLKHLDLTLLIVLIAIIFVNSTITKKVVNNVLNALVTGSLISTFVLLIIASSKLIKGISIKEITFHNFTLLYDQHPVYYSMFISLSLFFILFSKHIGGKHMLKNKYLFYSSIVMLILGLVLCASKAVLVLNLVAFISFYLFILKNRKRRLINLLVFVVIGITLYNIPFIKERFDDGIRLNKTISTFQPTNDFSKKKLFNYEEKLNISDLELRLLLIKLSTFHVLEDGKLWFGYGQGDTNDYLNYYYFSYNLGPNWFENRNVHNQYLHLIIMYGILVFFLFLFYVLYSFRDAFLNRDFLHLYFLLLICFVFIFEVVLVRNKGIIFFYFFNSLFLFNHKKFEGSTIRN